MKFPLSIIQLHSINMKLIFLTTLQQVIQWGYSQVIIFVPTPKLSPSANVTSWYISIKIFGVTFLTNSFFIRSIIYLPYFLFLWY